MIELESETLIGMIVGLVIVASVITGGAIKLFNRGRQAGMDDACQLRIEDKIDSLKEDLGEHEEQSGEIKKTLHKRIDDTNERINGVEIKVGEVSGKQDTMMKFLKEKL